jgi:hypothetical protein
MSGKGQREKKKGGEERLRVKTVGAHIESGCQKRAKRDKYFEAHNCSNSLQGFKKSGKFSTVPGRKYTAFPNPNIPYKR